MEDVKSNSSLFVEYKDGSEMPDRIFEMLKHKLREIKREEFRLQKIYSAQTGRFLSHNQ